MTVQRNLAVVADVRRAVIQVLIVFLINVPAVSFGLALGWVSLASGEAGGEAGGVAGGGAGGGGAVVAAVTTFSASLVGVPLSARALLAGRKVALIATSACFAVCWSLKLASAWGGAWCVLAARVAAGLGGAAAWALAPLLAREMCSDKYRGAAVAALGLAHNAGVLLMYLAADAAVRHRTVLCWCLGLSLVHCVVFAFLPESPSFLAAKGRIEEARAALARLRGARAGDAALEAELRALPAPQRDASPWSRAAQMLSNPQRRRAFVIGAVAVIGQEACGVLALLQYAERVFVLARDENLPSGASGPRALLSPARYAVLLGAVQLAMSALSLYLIERVGRRPLLIASALATGGALALCAALGARGAAGAGALALAVAADSLGLQPAPYALLADMFDYQYRSCALMLASAGACAGNALEAALFPLAAAAGGLRAALWLAAALTLAYALFAAALVPETRARSPQQVYDAVLPPRDCEQACTKM